MLFRSCFTFILLPLEAACALPGTNAADTNMRMSISQRREWNIILPRNVFFEAHGINIPTLPGTGNSITHTSTRPPLRRSPDTMFQNPIVHARDRNHSEIALEAIRKLLHTYFCNLLQQAKEHLPAPRTRKQPHYLFGNKPPTFNPEANTDQPSPSS